MKRRQVYTMFRLPIFGDIVSFFSDFHRMVIMNKRISCGCFQPTKHLIGNTCRTRPAFHRLQSVSCTEFTFQRSIETGEYLFLHFRTGPHAEIIPAIHNNNRQPTRYLPVSQSLFLLSLPDLSSISLFIFFR